MEAVKKIQQTEETKDRSKSVLEQINERKLKQVFLGVTGTLGSGASLCAEILRDNLQARGFDAKIIKVSEIIEAVQARSSTSNESIPEGGVERVLALQAKGNDLRKTVNRHITGKLICAAIKEYRDSLLGPDHEEDFSKQDKRIAFIIDSIKNHREVEFLKSVYQDSFFLFGLVTKEEICKTRLKQKGFKPAEISKLISAELHQSSDDHGQNVIKSLEQADFFIRNDLSQRSLLEEKIHRCLDLLFYSKVVTPTKCETGMYHAYVAGARSACLSRQVGAAIVSEEGDILATGCNDVPKAHGGLYRSEDMHDQRCYLKGAKCYNDYHKHRLLKRIVSELKKNGITFPEPKAGLKGGEEVILSEGLQDLIEFSRAVHAEMDAILQLARKTAGSSLGATMYTTTYPCHSCARHIVAAGIKTVYYIEPYKKSLATDLHDDSISTDGIDTLKVGFVPFEGVSPKRYLSLFKKSNWKEGSTGKIKLPTRQTLSEQDALPFDKFYEIESKAIKHLKDYLQ